MLLTLSSSIRKSTTCKLGYLCIISYIPDETEITFEEVPLINPYHAFTKPPNLFTRSIKSMIKHSPKSVNMSNQLSLINMNYPVTSQE